MTACSRIFVLSLLLGGLIAAAPRAAAQAVVLGNTTGGPVTDANPFILANAATTSPLYANNAVPGTALPVGPDNLVFAGADDLTLTADHTLTANRAFGVEADGGDLILSGRISGDFALFKTQSGTLALTAPDSTYTGTTLIHGGVLEVTHLADGGQASSIGASQSTTSSDSTALRVFNISTSGIEAPSNVLPSSPVANLVLGNGGTLRYTGAGDSTDRLIGILPGRRFFFDPVLHANFPNDPRFFEEPIVPVAIDASGTGALVFTNTAAVQQINQVGQPRILVLTGTNTDDNTFSLQFTDNRNAQTGSSLRRTNNQLVKDGTGTWIVTGDNTHTGGTIVNDGLLVLTGTNTADLPTTNTAETGTNSAGLATVTINGGKLLLGDSGTVLPDSSAVIVNAGTFQLGAADETIGSLGGVGGTVDLFNGMGRALTLAGNADNTYAGAIIGSGGALVKNGASTQVLLGANTYTGATTINAGTMHFAGASAFYGGVVDATNAAKLSVATAATATFNVGGADGLTTTHLDALLANAAFAPGSALALDTTDSGGLFSYTHNIANPIGLMKLGAGTLVLGGTNTYDGLTTISGGTLHFTVASAFYGGVVDAANATRLSIDSDATAAFNVGGLDEFTAVDLDTLRAYAAFASGSMLGMDTTNAVGGTFSYTGNIDGEIGLNKLGAGILVLSGANTYTGPTTITGGTLRAVGGAAISDGSAVALASSTLELATSETIGSLAGGGSVVLGANTLTTGGNGGSTAFSGAISGNGSLVKEGDGTLTLSGENTYIGLTTITGGTLQFTQASAFYGGVIDAASTAKLTLGAGATAILNVGGAGEFTLADFTTLRAGGSFAAGSAFGLNTTHASGPIDYAGSMGGSVGFIKAGSGTLALLGENTYTGTTTVTGGTLVLPRLSALYGGVIDATAAAKLTLGAGATAILNVGGAGEFTLADFTTLQAGGSFAAGSALGLDTSHASAPIDYADNLSGAVGFIKAGSGTLTLSGVNTYTGPTSIAGGTLQFTGASALYGGVIDAAAAAKFSVDSGATAAFNVGGPDGFGAPHLDALLAHAAFASGSTLALDTANSGGSFSYASNIANPINLTKLGAGTLVLSGANTYTGTTTISGGTLQFANVSAFYDGIVDATTAAKLTVASGATAAFNVGGASGFSASSLNTLLGGASFAAGSGLALDTSNSSGTFSFSPVASSVTSLTKLGTGALSLYEPVDYSGSVSVNGGTLGFASPTWTIGSLSGSVAGTLRFDDYYGGQSFQSLIVNQADNTVFAGQIVEAEAAGVLVKTGIGELTLSGSNTVDYVAGEGILRFTHPRTFNITGSYPYTAQSYLNFNQLSSGANGTAVFVLGYSNGFSQDTLELMFNRGNISIGPEYQGNLPARIGLEVGTGSSYEYVIPLSGNFHLSKHGNGTLELSNSNNGFYSASIIGGTLRVSGGNAIPDSIAVTLASDPGVTFDLGSSETIGALVGGGAVTLGTNTLTLTTVKNNAMFLDSATFDGAISGSGNLVKSKHVGSGNFVSTQILSGTNTYTGTTTVTNGTLQFAKASAFYNGVIDATTAAKLTVTATLPDPAKAVFNVGGTGEFTAAHIATLAADANFSPGSTLGLDTTNAVGGIFSQSHPISGPQDLEKLGVGTLVLSGANTYTGKTSVSAGSLVNNGSLASVVSIGGGAILGGSGTFSNLVTLSPGATLAPGNSPGTITFTAGLTLEAGSILNFDLGTISDLIRVSGGVLTGPGTGAVTLNFSDSGGFAAGDYTLFDYSSATLSDFDLTDFTLGTTVSGYTYNLSLGGSTLVLTATLAAVPEPATYALLAGLFILGLAAYRRRHS